MFYSLREKTNNIFLKAKKLDFIKTSLVHKMCPNCVCYSNRDMEIKEAKYY